MPSAARRLQPRLLPKQQRSAETRPGSWTPLLRFSRPTATSKGPGTALTHRFVLAQPERLDVPAFVDEMVALVTRYLTAAT
jgi:hypothetical protein